MNTYKAGFVGTGKVLHLTNARTTYCFDSGRGNSRVIYSAVATSDIASEALNLAIAKTGAKVCAICAKVGA